MSDELLSQLVDDLEPVVSIRPWYCVVKWTMFAALYVLGWTLIMGIRTDIEVKLQDPSYVVELLMSIGLIVGAGSAAVFSSVPGVKARILNVTATLSACVIGALIVTMALAMSMSDWRVAFNIGHLKVTSMLIGLSLAPALLLIYFIRSSAPTQLRNTGALTGLAACGSAYMILRLVMPDDNVVNVLLWCYMPMVMFIGLCYYTARLWLRW